MRPVFYFDEIGSCRENEIKPQSKTGKPVIFRQPAFKVCKKLLICKLLHALPCFRTFHVH